MDDLRLSSRVSDNSLPSSEYKQEATFHTPYSIPDCFVYQWFLIEQSMALCASNPGTEASEKYKIYFNSLGSSCIEIKIARFCHVIVFSETNLHLHYFRTNSLHKSLINRYTKKCTFPCIFFESCISCDESASCHSRHAFCMKRVTLLKMISFSHYPRFANDLRLPDLSGDFTYLHRYDLDLSEQIPCHNCICSLRQNFHIVH